jgi:putative FmdB family regulatory protein
MPVYEFICDRCKRKFDVLFRSLNDRPKVMCPKCKGDDVRKAFSVFGVSGGSKGDGSSGGGSGCPSCSRASCKGCHH